MTATILTPVGRFGRYARRWISKHPAIYLPLRRARKPETVVNRQTELLIEGYPRSGNTWTEALIRHTRPDVVRLAHHSHAPAHVKHALKIDVPVMILFREPDAAVQSYLTLTGNKMDAGDAYLDYESFYLNTAPLAAKGVAFFSFEDVVSSPVRVLDELNGRFELGLALDRAKGDEGRQAVFDLMDEKGRRLKREGGKSTSRPGTASDSKADIKALAIQATEAPAAQSARRRAKAVYATLRSCLGDAQ